MKNGKDFPVPHPSRDAASRIAALSPRCREVLNGIVAGHSSKLIAYKLGISPRTVEVHRANLKRRLGAHNVAEAIRVAYEAQLITERLHRYDEPQRWENEALEFFGKAASEKRDLFPISRSWRSRTK
jgi:DNA-binding CsgD family transcriptional regulator